jgi:hypothetical protein
LVTKDGGYPDQKDCTGEKKLELSAAATLACERVCVAVGKVDNDKRGRYDDDEIEI